MTTPTSRSRNDSVPVLVLGALAVTAAFALTLLGSDAYRTVLGVDAPLWATLALAAWGWVAWRLAVRRGWLPGDAAGTQGYFPAVVLGLCLPLPVVLVDVQGGFGPDINVAWPHSLLFYPSIAFVAEVAFHVTPLALSAALAAASGSPPTTRALRRTGLFVAASVEALLQVAWGAGSSPAWANAYVGVHLLVFNVIGVRLLTRYGFVRVYVYRLAYYVVWHLAWGHMRLTLLFPS